MDPLVVVRFPWCDRKDGTFQNVLKVYADRRRRKKSKEEIKLESEWKETAWIQTYVERMCPSYIDPGPEPRFDPPQAGYYGVYSRVDGNNGSECILERFHATSTRIVVSDCLAAVGAKEEQLQLVEGTEFRIHPDHELAIREQFFRSEEAKRNAEIEEVNRQIEREKRFIQHATERLNTLLENKTTM